MKVDATKEHRWLQQLVGEWTFESECGGGPEGETMKSTGTERVRSIGELWIQAEGRGEMPGGAGMANWMLTVGYDPERKHYVGAWVGSMMTHLWVYEGSLDPAGKVLTLNTEGPAMGPEGLIPGKKAKYREILEIKSPDHRTFTSEVQGEDGKWTQIMCAHYRRTK